MVLAASTSSGIRFEETVMLLEEIVMKNNASE